jgi:hypothetical protein
MDDRGRYLRWPNRKPPQLISDAIGLRLALLGSIFVFQSLVTCQVAAAGQMVAQNAPTVLHVRSGSFLHSAKGVSYAVLRRKLIRSRWQPAITANADRCGTGDARCEGRPEMQSCAGTGEANCLFLWRKDGTLLAISTIGDPAIVDAVECRNCR